jgi:uncharacterized protein YcfJ
MKRFQLVVAVAVVALCATAAIAQDRVARMPSAMEQAAAARPSQAQAAIDQAATEQKYCLIFFWRDKNANTDKAWSSLSSAAGGLADSAVVIAVQITDPAEKQVVDRFGVARSAMPMVLAVAPCGAVTKGFTGAVDEAKLRTAFVSPCTAACMKALQQRKLVLLCVKPSSSQVKEVSLQKGVEDFAKDPQYAKTSAVVVLNAGDRAEESFLKDLKVDPRTPAQVTVLLSPPGSVIGTLVGNVTEDQIVAKIKAASACGPNCACHQK